ncbi:hypothetical protein PR003_g9356 [Phytophthora rubi]|uniref:Reverse transcriptase domain-containing protein n=1 Tax=Phytophthora rubi TaxID=129364 RepID=A0A6A3MTF5_9STRA|nr:hypothetical protein PR002_g21635 [Phytophthora rubi]KAE9036452.1 hypothetical protein PR001_g8833 [Phytophthora rubi]KAE9342683.1 hypothetical protein PR003_g9356 [Phytophthora rubi]
MDQQSTEWSTLRRDRSSPDPKGPSPPNVEMRSGVGGGAVATCATLATQNGTPPAEGIPDAGLGSDPLHVEICVDADRRTEEASVAAGMPEAPAATAEEGAVSSEREDDSAQSDDVLDQEPMRKIGPQEERVPRPPAQGTTKKIPPEDYRVSASAPTPDNIPQGLPGQASKDPEPNPDPETRRSDPEGGSEVCHHDGGILEAEEVDGEWAVLPEVSPATIEVRIEDLQVGDLADNTEDEIRKLRDIIWAHRHLLIGKSNALPPAAVGAICDIDVGSVAPIAQRVREIAPQFREKVSDLLKGLLSAKIIRHSTSPWASPIVVIIKKNGVDIRLCIDYRQVNGLTKLMIYLMPLINDLLEDLGKVL